MTSLQNNSVFITGATGFIGSHIARKYVADGRTVSALYRKTSGYGMLADIADQISWHEGDVLDIASLETAIQPNSDVIHAAAIVSFSQKDHDRMERINVEGTANVVNVCLNTGIRRLGYVSSVATLGRPLVKGDTSDKPIVITERQKWQESPNNSAYAKSKYRAELEVWRGVAEGLDAVMVNPSIVLGTGDWERSSLQLIKYVMDERPFYPPGLINYVDVLDVTDALFWLMQDDTHTKSGQSQRYVLNGGTIPYHSLLEQLAEVLGKRPPALAVPSTLLRLLWPFEAVRAWILGKAPLITRETARSASSFYQYDGREIEQVSGLQYRPLSETLKRVADAYRRRT